MSADKNKQTYRRNNNRERNSLTENFKIYKYFKFWKFINILSMLITILNIAVNE